MTKDLEQIVERIGQLPDDAEMSNTAIGLDPLAIVPSFFTTDDLKKLASAYTKAVSDLEKAKAGLEHYADESFFDDPHPDLGYANGTLYNFEDEIDGQIPGYTVAQQTLDALESEKR